MGIVNGIAAAAVVVADRLVIADCEGYRVARFVSLNNEQGRC